MIVDTKNKTVDIQDECFGQAVKELMVMFPNDEWKEYKIVPRIITIEKYIPSPFQTFPVMPSIPSPVYPYIDPWNPFRITCEDTAGISHTEGEALIIDMSNNYRA